MSCCNHTLRKWVTCAAALALSACTTVGPNYRVPDEAVVRAVAAQAPFAGSAPGIATDSALPDRWWHLYNDPVLDQLEEHALAANIDLRVAAANLEHARAVTSGAESRNEPDIATLATIAAIGPAECDRPLTAERDAARATVATADIQLGFVDTGAHRTP